MQKKILMRQLSCTTELWIFKERRLNVIGKTPIYIDLDSFLHIYMRHVEEFKVTDHFEDKDNFQWEEDDVYGVMAINLTKDLKAYYSFADEGL